MDSANIPDEQAAFLRLLGIDLDALADPLVFVRAAQAQQQELLNASLKAQRDALDLHRGILLGLVEGLEPAGETPAVGEGIQAVIKGYLDFSQQALEQQRLFAQQLLDVWSDAAAAMATKANDANTEPADGTDGVDGTDE